TRLLVREEQQTDELFALTNLEPDRITLFLRSRIVGDRVKEALQKVVQLRDRLARTQADRARFQQRAAEIDQEQSRIRENLGKLAQNSDLYNRYIMKLDQQETELDDLRPRIEKLKDVEASQQRELDDYLLGLDIDG
ncbi:MAG: hypothetical protein JO116_19120, partial [Planctomycetaceae bacterium]|nr:hypothetical protein [Planctomycetaceae bacterium]